MLWDTHMHTRFSTDGSAEPAAMAEKALALGLDGICFTDHLDYDYPLVKPGGKPEFLLDIDEYCPSVSTVKKQYFGKLPILTGIELGLQPHLAARHYELLKDSSFDFVIGSSHVVHGQDPYYASYYEGRREEDAYLEYFVSILENIEAFDGFDVYGHIDYVVRYGPNKNLDYSYEKYAEPIDEILKLLIAKGKGIELNTAGFKYGLGHPHPTEDILKRYRELGGEIITLGSDAHAPEQIAYDFAKVPAILKEAGFQYYTVFRQRIPQFLPL